MSEKILSLLIPETICCVFDKTKPTHIKNNEYTYKETESLVYEFKLSKTKRDEYCIVLKDSHHTSCCGYSCDFYRCEEIYDNA